MITLLGHKDIADFKTALSPESEKERVSRVDQVFDRICFYVVAEEEKDVRLDVFLASKVEDLTRSRAQELIREGFVRVNDRSQKTSYRLRTGDQVNLCLPPVATYQLQPEPVAFTPIYEDASLIVVNKPAGLVVHPAPGHREGTLVHGLLHYCKDLSGIGGQLRPGIVHRLDKDTSGLILVAKNDRTHQALSRQFKAGTVKKIYLALVHGTMDNEEGVIDLPIARHPSKRKEMAVQPFRGRKALTLWKKLEEPGGISSLLSVTLKTGRTHQIRVHLSYSGHPVLGDAVYGFRKNAVKGSGFLRTKVLQEIGRQMLHAETIGFIHPETERYCEFYAPMPEDMDLVIRRLREIA